MFMSLSIHSSEKHGMSKISKIRYDNLYGSVEKSFNQMKASPECISIIVDENEYWYHLSE